MVVRTPKKVAISVLALGAASAAVMFGSFAAWTAQTSNPGNSVTTGELVLTGNPADGVAIITATGLMPGQNGTQAITLTNGGTGAMALTLTQSTPVQGAAALGLSIDDGSNCYYPVAATGLCASYGSWSGPISNLALGTLTTATPRTFNINYELDSGSLNADQNKVNTFDLTWTGDPS